MVAIAVLHVLRFGADRFRDLIGLLVRVTGWNLKQWLRFPMYLSQALRQVLSLVSLLFQNADSTTTWLGRALTAFESL